MALADSSSADDFLPSVETNRDFQSFFELSGNGNVIADIHADRFLRVNQTYCDITGYSAEELLRMNATDLTHPEDRERDQLGWLDCVEQSLTHFEIEKRYRRKDGTVVWVSVTSTLVRNERGEPVHAIGVVRDVTDRRVAIAELERVQLELENRVHERTTKLTEANTTLATLFDACPLAILTLDHEYRVTSWNRSAESLLGWTEEEVLGQMLPNAPTAPQVVQQFFEAVKTNQAIQLDVPWKAKDGRTLDLAAWYAPLYQAPETLIGHVALLMDISEKRFLEKALLEESEREQRRIGQDLHDHLAQHLLGAAFAAKALEGDLRREGSPQAERLDDLARLLNEAVRQVRDISRGLHPVELDSAGLMSSLEELAAKINRSIECRFVCKQAVFVHDPKVALHVYRIAQEAVAIAQEDKSGKRMAISLLTNGGEVTLEIRKSGRSASKPLILDETSPKIMEYRAKAIGGRFQIENQTAKDLQIRCTFPNPTL